MSPLAAELLQRTLEHLLLVAVALGLALLVTVGTATIAAAIGADGLARRYGLQLSAPPRAMDLGLTCRALAAGQVDLIAGDSTNGLIRALDLAILADDRGYFPPYDAVPVFRSASLRRHADLAQAVQRVAGRLDATTMQGLYAVVDLNQQPLERVVRNWRRSAGLEAPLRCAPLACPDADEPAPCWPCSWGCC